MKTALFCLFENWHSDYTKAIKDQIDLVCYAENLGFDEAWVTEHHFNNFSVTPAPLSIVNHLLGKTKKMKIGTAAVLLPYYDPVKLAEEISVIKAVDDDRFVFGIAKGAFPIYDKTFKGDPKTNRDAMFEANMLIHKLLKEEQVSFKGEFYSCDDITIRPGFKGDFQTVIASQSEEAIKEAAYYGYGLVGSLAVSKEQIKDIFNKYESFEPSRPLSFRLARAVNIGYDKEEILKETQYSADVFLQSMLASKDTNPTLVKLLDDNYMEIRNKLFDKNRILQNSICGTPAECIEQIRELKYEFNIESLLLKPATSSLSRTREVLELYANEVQPYV